MTPTIVVLDGHALNPGDLSWSGLEALGPCRVHPRSTPAEVRERAAHAEFLITNKAPLGRELLEALPRLRYIGVTATGYNIVDVAAARDRGITVTNVPAYGTRSVAQHTLALLLELTQHAGRHAAGTRAGQWSANPDWCYWETPLIELDGLTLGIVGYGRIGQAVARLGEALGMKVITAVSGRGTPPKNVAVVDLDHLFEASDVVSLHCPLTPETRHLVNRARLARMKPSAFLLNTSRGPLIDEPALAQALNEGRLAGAGLDVLAQEPPPADHPLLTARNCLITPHLAWATRAARQRLMHTVVENARAFLAGHPVNVVTG
ncbi:MAG: lactate dehydrogenase/2-hydroxyacid dehydrogenase [Verrucomicrobiota bacterium]